jgi:phage-related protein
MGFQALAVCRKREIRVVCDVWEAEVGREKTDIRFKVEDVSETEGGIVCIYTL